MLLHPIETHLLNGQPPKILNLIFTTNMGFPKIARKPRRKKKRGLCRLKGVLLGSMEGGTTKDSLEVLDPTGVTFRLFRFSKPAEGLELIAERV